jgi:hypothetical protein
MSDPEKLWGVEAIGVHAQISAELLSSAKGVTAWLLQITGATWHFAVSVEDPSAISSAADFIDAYAEREEFAEHKLGVFHSADVLLVKDSEHGDRFWLRARGSGQLVEIAIQGSDAVALQRAIRQLADELR